MATQERAKYLKIFSVISAVMLLLAIPPIWPYFYYQILRWVVTGTAIFSALTVYELNKTKWAFVMGATAILFNPIVPFYLDKNVWVVLDLISAVIFLAVLKSIKT